MGSNSRPPAHRRINMIKVSYALTTRPRRRFIYIIIIQLYQSFDKHIDGIQTYQCFVRYLYNIIINIICIPIHHYFNYIQSFNWYTINMQCITIVIDIDHIQYFFMIDQPNFFQPRVSEYTNENQSWHIRMSSFRTNKNNLYKSHSLHLIMHNTYNTLLLNNIFK